MRAAQLLHSLLAIEQVAGGAHEQVLARVRPDTLAAIRGASWLDWLPLEFDIELAEAVAAVLGPEADRARARQSLLLTFESPLLRPFVRAVQTVYELEPASVIRQTPRAWPVVFRDAGRMSYVIGEGAERVLVYSEVPALVIGNRLYLDAIAGAAEALLELCRVEGSVAVEAVDPAQRRAELRFSWY